ALRTCEEGLRRLHGGNLYALGCLHLASGVGRIARGEMAEAHVSLQVARATYENGQSRFGAAMAFALLGLTYAIEGRLERALCAWREGESLVHLLPTASSTESIAVGYAPLVLYEQNRLDAVDAYLARCFARTAEILLPDMVSALYVAAARTAFARDDHDRAADYLEEAENIGLRRKWPRLVLVASAERISLALRRGDWNEAMRLKKAMDARQASLPAGLQGMDLEGPGLLDWRIKVFKEPSRSLISELHTAAARAVAEKRIWRAIRLMVLEAVARDRMGARSGALRTMARAIGMGALGGFVRVFADAGRASVDLLRELAEQEARTPSTPPIDYRSVLAAARLDMPAKRDVDEPLEALSPRETDVLRMVAAGLSNRELARRLAVSENTVKWHLQRIFAKVGAKNRTRAAVIARRRGLIT
ncbi:MAG: LuxR C-terminal-related transcriptional regulator, partial [Acetobacteraceae bacterium]